MDLRIRPDVFQPVGQLPPELKNLKQETLYAFFQMALRWGRRVKDEIYFFKEFEKFIDEYFRVAFDPISIKMAVLNRLLVPVSLIFSPEIDLIRFSTKDGVSVFWEPDLTAELADFKLWDIDRQAKKRGLIDTTSQIRLFKEP